MSFVSIFATSDRLSVMSDGRVSKGKIPVCENYQKFTIHETSFVAATGSFIACKSLRDQVIEMFKTRNDYYSISEAIKLEICELKSKKEKVMISFGGKNSDGKIEFYTLSTSDDVMSHQVPKTKNDLEYNLLISDAVKETNFPDKIDFLLKKNKYDIVTTQEQLNEEISNVDNSVNNFMINHIIE